VPEKYRRPPIVMCHQLVLMGSELVAICFSVATSPARRRARRRGPMPPIS